MVPSRATIPPMPGRDYDVRLKSNGAYWQAWWYDDAAPGGKRVKSLGAKARFSERQASAKCRDLALELRRRGPSAGDKVPRLSAWIEQYKALRTDLAPGTMRMVDQVGRLLLQFFSNDPAIDHITRSDAANWRVALERGELRGANIYPKPDSALAPNTKYQKYRKALKAKAPKPMSATNVARLTRVAKRMFEEAADDNGLGLIDRNPFRRLSGKAPKGAKNWQEVTIADLGRIVAACPNEGWRLLFQLTRRTGMRRGEALRLRWRDIDFAANRIVVNGAIAKETTKVSRRVIPIDPARCPLGLGAILREAYDLAPEGAEFVCNGVGLDKIDRQAKAIIAAAGVAPYAKPFHTLRKNREGELARHYPQHVLKEWMGHDPDVADEHYLRVDEDLYAAPKKSRAQIVPKRVKRQ